MKALISIIALSLLFTACATPEYVMPFRNLGYPERFPLQQSDLNFTFRVSANFSTSIDRIITVYKDSLNGQGSMLLQIQHLKRKKGVEHLKYKEMPIRPAGGIEQFIKGLDSLYLMSMKSQKEEDVEIPTDQPFSFYVVEIKKNGKYNQFKFYTHFPVNADVNNDYDRIQKFIFKEFKMPFYFKEAGQGQGR